ncbi:MAG: outer membrane beta-barrel protein [Ginsengibacter sp.]
MKKVLLGLTIIALGITSANAQKGTSSMPITFSIGLEPAIPIGNFQDVYGFGIGGTLQGEYKPADDLGLTLNTGYINYSGKNITFNGVTIDAGNFGIIPFLAGVKYYFSPKAYAHGQLGAAFSTSSGGGTSFAYTPGVGFILSKNIDLLVKYVAYSKNKETLSSIGARLAYNFGK